jgi:hypothetical protein
MQSCGEYMMTSKRSHPNAWPQLEDAKKVIFMELYLVRGVAWEWNLSTSVAFGGFLELE